MKPGILRLFVLGLIIGTLSSADASAAPKNGQKFGNWLVRCAKDAKDDCVLVQTQVVDGGARLIEFSVGKVGTKGEFGGIAMLPLGLHIPSGVILVVDGKQLPMTLLKCTQDGCQAVVPLDKANADGLGKARQILVGMVDEFTRKTVTIPVSTDGLPEGMAAMK